MAPISFARGAPSPACLDPELLSDCSRAALERDAAEANVGLVKLLRLVYSISPALARRIMIRF